MKKIVLLLLLANGGVFLYWRYVAPAAIPEPTALATPEAPPTKILLAAERPAPTPQCQSLGPIATRPLLVSVMRWLGDRYGTLTEREAAVPAPPAYRVQIATTSADLAARLAQRLKSLGTGDVAVLAPDPGETTVIVAFGLFGDHANAERRVAELRKHAVDATIATLERRTTQWWVELNSVDVPDRDALLRAVPGTSAVMLAPCELAAPSEEGPAGPEATPESGDAKGPAAPKARPSRGGAAA